MIKPNDGSPAQRPMLDGTVEVLEGSVKRHANHRGSARKGERALGQTSTRSVSSSHQMTSSVGTSNTSATMTNTYTSIPITTGRTTKLVPITVSTVSANSLVVDPLLTLFER